MPTPNATSWPFRKGDDPRTRRKVEELMEEAVHQHMAFTDPEHRLAARQLVREAIVKARVECAAIADNHWISLGSTIAEEIRNLDKPTD